MSFVAFLVVSLLVLLLVFLVVWLVMTSSSILPYLQPLSSSCSLSPVQHGADLDPVDLDLNVDFKSDPTRLAGCPRLGGGEGERFKSKNKSKNKSKSN